MHTKCSIFVLLELILIILLRYHVMGVFDSMIRRTLFNVHYLFSSVTHQARSFSQKTVPNQVSQYFCQAKLIDSIRLSLRSGSLDSLDPLLEHPNLDSFVVTNAIRSAPSPESALSFVEVLKRVPEFSHTQHTLYAIAKVFAKSGRIRQLKKLVDAINGGEFPKVRRVSCMDQMRWYAIAGDIELVLTVRDELRARRKRPCIEYNNIVMDLYVKMGKDLEAVQTFQNIMQEGTIPNSRTFTIVVEHLINSGKVENAKEVFDILPRMRFKRTLRQYSVLIEAFVKFQKFEDVKKLLKEMKTEGLLPPRSTLLSLQHMYEAGVLEEGDEVFKEMVPDYRIQNIELSVELNNGNDEEDCDDCSSESDVSSVQLKPWLDPSALVHALRHWRDDDISALEEAKLIWTSRLVCKMVRHFKSPQTAWQFFCWVTKQPGFMHDIHTYTGIITKVASHGRVDLVDDLLLKLKNEGFKLAISTVRQIIDFYGLFKEGDAALKVFHDVKVLCNQLSDFDYVLLYSSLLRTLLKCGRDNDAIDTVKQMSNVGIHPDAQTYSGLMHHFAVQGDFRTIQNIFEMLRKCGVHSDAFMYKTLVRAYCKCGRATLALRLLEDIRNAGLLPDRETKSLLVKGLWKEGRLREASIVEETCKEGDHILPLPSASQMFNVSSADLLIIHKLYSGSILSTFN
ncbi:pentatricopeptide repeat-containing protein At5g66631 [Amaranthus tricolor]|uniref:pentatricopeptide repeat-containing protein At5g66631 n=1 Tax=Amaranthus tricolor TaxID=29722 RepID=UPI002590DD21|nr:pentatricopeptide repeat-containing protein At5g66631 [Amaranthus tricolor]